MSIPLILGSSSIVRKQLLQSAGINVANIISANIDETPLKGELPKQLATRLALNKNLAVEIPSQYHQGQCLLLTADTVVAAGRRIIDKAHDDEDVLNAINLMSGRRIRVYSAIALTKFENNNLVKQWQHTNYTVVTFKCISQMERDMYVKSKEGIGKGGGLMAEGIAAKYIKNINGCYPTVLGLPLYQLHQYLLAAGYYH